MADEYATLPQLQSLRNSQATSVAPAGDTELQRRLTVASRAIDKKTGREPGGFLADGSASQRTFRTANRRVPAVDGELLLVDEISTEAGLIVEVSNDGTTWTAVTNYTAEPLDALVKSRPVTGLRRDRSAWTAYLVRVTADWGWPAVPDEIVEATLLLANRLVLRKDSPEGVAGSPEWGVLRLSRWDPDVETLIGPYVLPGFA